MPIQPRQLVDTAPSEDTRLDGRDRVDEDFGPAWYVIALERWWRLVFIGALVGGVIAFWYASARPLRYQGVTTLLVVPPPSQPGIAVNTVNPATFRNLVQNLTLASEVIDELKLQDIRPHGFLEAALAVDEIRGTNIVKVKVTLADPKLAAEASRRLAQKAILLAQQIAQQEGASVQEQLKRHLEDAARRMSDAERELLDYKQRAQVDLVMADTNAQLKERVDLLPLVIAIETERARLAAAENEIKRQHPVLESARTPAAEEALRRVQSSSNPTEGAVDEQHLDLTNPFVNPVFQTLDFQIATSRTRIAALEKERDQIINVKKLGGKEFDQLSELYRRQIELARRQAGYDVATRVHADLALRYEQSRTQPLGLTSQLQVVDPALPPDDPLGQKRLQFGIVGAGMGFMSTALLALLWEGSKTKRAA